MVFSCDQNLIGSVDLYEGDNGKRESWVCSLGRTMYRDCSIVFAKMVLEYLREKGYKCETQDPIPAFVTVKRIRGGQFGRRMAMFYMHDYRWGWER